MILVKRVELELGDLVRVGNGGCWFTARTRLATQTYAENPGYEFVAMCTLAPRSSTSKDVDSNVISIFGPIQDDSWVTLIASGLTDYEAAVAATALLG